MIKSVKTLTMMAQISVLNRKGKRELGNGYPFTLLALKMSAYVTL